MNRSAPEDLEDVLLQNAVTAGKSEEIVRSYGPGKQRATRLTESPLLVSVDSKLSVEWCGEDVAPEH